MLWISFVVGDGQMKKIWSGGSWINSPPQSDAGKSEYFQLQFKMHHYMPAAQPNSSASL